MCNIDLRHFHSWENDERVSQYSVAEAKVNRLIPADYLPTHLEDPLLADMNMVFYKVVLCVVSSQQQQ